ncbi:cyclodeaminase/cyclohydrolase family protein [bacterium]|uniref:cyclodeaminase/cyclohydrolase family protein n=1 Tax=unclassified Bariatricus TaxID=2677046 RepID=UPI002A8814AD|nr:cyclodeaminase/cyclohydrolase family protein [bacterium]MDD7142691.1 cyclodeaminase/cyclohydrolase family protein [bacterium]MDY4504148.1 cyclodeaminase/cyclohydrolase family protein [Bariatricus sp.]MDY5457940.1 cyclodeaminase/cyclohydrolase family protein [Bariatricus sp.]
MMLEKKTTEFLEELSSSAPVPGGGGASAAAGAYAAALGLMVGNLTTGKKKYADVEEEICESMKKLEQLRDKLTRLVDEDAKAFEPLSKAYGMPKETEEQKKLKEQVMETALREACRVPLEIMEVSIEVMELLQVLEEKGSRLAVSDAGVGILFAKTSLEGASLNVFINTRLMKDRKYAEELNQRADAWIARGRTLEQQVYHGVLEKIR